MYTVSGKWTIPRRRFLTAGFRQSLCGVRPGLETGMNKIDALIGAKAWLRALPAAEAKSPGESLIWGMVESLLDLPELAVLSNRPYAHAYYWAAFDRIGPPD